MEITQILDDRNPAVVYSSGWLRAGSSNEFNRTTSSAGDSGLIATLVFQGVQVIVYGTIGARDVQRLSPQSNYSVDDSPPFTYQAAQTSSVQYSTPFYTSPRLPYGPHTLVVTNLIASDALFLDYFLVLRPDNVTTPSQLVPTTSKFPSQTPSPPAATVESKPSSSSNTGTIVGSALGAAALVILAVGLMFWFRSRNRRTWPDDTRATSFRENRPSEANPQTRQAAPRSAESPYPTSSDSARYSSSSPQQNPYTVYDPYDASSISPPGYIHGDSQGRREYLPSKFIQAHRSTPSAAS